MEDDRMLELALKEVDSLITEEERKELREWMEASEANRLKVLHVQKAWQMTVLPGKTINIDLDRDYAKVRSKIRQGRLWIFRPWQIAAAVLLLTGLFFFFYSQMGRVTYPGPAEQLVLNDGSQIWLKENAVFHYSDRRKSRKAVLEGSGYFEIAQDRHRPFEISTTLGVVTVLGTAFEIEMAGQDVLLVSVVQGRVRLSTPDNQAVELEKGETGAVTGTNLEKRITLNPVATWRLQPISFSQVAFGDVLEEITKFYPVDFDIENSAILQCKVSITLSYPPIDELIMILETLLDIRIEQQSTVDGGNRLQYAISGSGCQ